MPGRKWCYTPLQCGFQCTTIGENGWHFANKQLVHPPDTTPYLIAVQATCCLSLRPSMPKTWSRQLMLWVAIPSSLLDTPTAPTGCLPNVHGPAPQTYSTQLPPKSSAQRAQGYGTPHGVSIIDSHRLLLQTLSLRWAAGKDLTVPHPGLAIY